nr:hypothetical protein [uncultured Pseudoalteromonas sp.]
MNTDSGKSVKSVHDKTGMSVHAKTRTGVHDGPESLFTMLRNMQMIFLSKAKPIAFYYLIVGLSFNAFVFYGMHYDSIVLGNIEYWWFWGLYGIGQLTSDLVMALVLFINKDILGLVKLKRALFNRNELQAMAKK